MSEFLPLSDIKQDASTQPRLKMDMDIIEEYADAMKNGAAFPPLIVFRVDERFILVDGYHRLWAAQNASIKKYLCEIHEGTMRDALLYSVGVNATHGLRRTNDDKRRAVERLLVDSEWGKWSDNKIAEICNVSHQFVGKYRGVTCNITSDNSQRTRLYATKHGTTSIMNTDKIGKKAPYNGTPQKPNQTAAPPPAPSNPHLAQLPETILAPEPPWKCGAPCPDGLDHTQEEEIRGKVCGLLFVPCNQVLKERCPVLVRQVPVQEQVSLPTDEYDQITGARFIKLAPVRIVKAPEIITWEPSPKQWDFIQRVMKSKPDEYSKPEEVVSAAIDRAMEREEGA